MSLFPAIAAYQDQQEFFSGRTHVRMGQRKGEIGFEKSCLVAVIKALALEAQAGEMFGSNR